MPSPPAYDRVRPKGARNGPWKTAALLQSSPSGEDDLTQFPSAGAACEASPGEQVARRRGRLKGSKNRPIGEWDLISSCASCL